MKYTNNVTAKTSRLARFLAQALVYSVSSLPMLSYGADGGEEFVLEEIVVTAQKRAQNLQDIP